jgi:uncharacterized protein YbjT (DUF2867 family)
VNRFPQKIFVAGATGGTGVRTIARLRQMGVGVRVFTRDRNRASRFQDIEVVEGNALVKSDCSRAIEGCDAVAQRHGMPWLTWPFVAWVRQTPLVPFSLS